MYLRARRKQIHGICSTGLSSKCSYHCGKSYRSQHTAQLTPLPSVKYTKFVIPSAVSLCPFNLALFFIYLFIFYLGDFKHIWSSRGITANPAIFAGKKRAFKDQGFPFLRKKEVNGLLQAETVRAFVRIGAP